MVNLDSLPPAYRQHFHGSEPSVMVRAPGRVNLIGEHVDYNGGPVLPIAIERATYAVAGPGESGKIRVFSASLGKAVEFAVTDDHRPDARTWDAYPRGVAAELRRAGVRVTGTNIYLDSDVPVGAGLSSSAALEVAIALALLLVAGDSLPPVEVARICREAEHHYAGVPCGIMDQSVCVLAEADSALLLDCANGEVTHIRWPDRDAVVLVVDSQCRHKLSDGTYATRVRECRRAVEIVRRVDPAVQSLREVSLERLAAQRSEMDETIFRRARHVVGEISRTKAAAEALRRASFRSLGWLMNESHESLRADYEVSSPELDDLAATVRGVPGVYGARMTGAGFGGCIVAVGARGAVAEVAAAVREKYDPRYGVTATVLVTRPCRGATATAVAKR